MKYIYVLAFLMVAQMHLVEATVCCDGVTYPDGWVCCPTPADPSFAVDNVTVICCDGKVTYPILGTCCTPAQKAQYNKEYDDCVATAQKTKKDQDKIIEDTYNKGIANINNEIAQAKANCTALWGTCCDGPCKIEVQIGGDTEEEVLTGIYASAIASEELALALSINDCRDTRLNKCQNW